MVLQRKRNRERAAEGTDELAQNQPAGADAQPEGTLPSSTGAAEQPVGGQDGTSLGGELIINDDGMAFLYSVKECLKDADMDKYNELLGLMIKFTTKEVTKACFVGRVMKLFQGNKEVLDHINKPLQPSFRMISTDDTWKSKELGPLYAAKLRDRSWKSYTTLIYILYLYKERAISSDQVDQEVQWLLAKECDLLEEFEYFRLDERPVHVVESAPHPRHQEQLLLPSEWDQRCERIREMCRARLTGKGGKGKLQLSIGGAADSVGRRSSDRDVEPAESSRRRAEKVSSKDLKLWDTELRISQLDLSESEECTPSFRLLPEWYPRLVSEHRTELAKSVLNDDYVQWTTGSELFKHRTLNKYEEVLFRCEDDQHNCDVYVEWMMATATHMSEYLESLPEESLEEGTSEAVQPMEKFLTALDQRVIKLLYDGYGEEFLELVKETPAKALPIIRSRVLEKMEEWKNAREQMKVKWSQAYRKNLHRSLDHQSVLADLAARHQRSVRGKAKVDAGSSDENTMEVEEPEPVPEKTMEVEEPGADS